MIDSNYGKRINGLINYLTIPVVLDADIIIDGITHPAGASLFTANEDALIQLGYKRIVDNPRPADAIRCYWKESETEIIKVWENQTECNNRISAELREQNIQEKIIGPEDAYIDIMGAITKQEPVILNSVASETMAWGGSKDVNGDFAAAGIPIYNLGYQGGYIITGENDLSLAIITHDLGIKPGYYLQRIKAILDKYVDGVTIDNNDILINGKKVLGSAQFATNNMYAFVFGASFTDYTDLIYQLCPPQTGKAPGYITGCTAEQLKSEIMEWFNRKE